MRSIAARIVDTVLVGNILSGGDGSIARWQAVYTGNGDLPGGSRTTVCQ